MNTKTSLRCGRLPPVNNDTYGFTLIELLVSMVIISILASLVLSGLFAARTAAKRAITETTIRKINEVILGQYETYLSNRVNTIVSEGDSPAGRLIARRRLIALEMPERFTEIDCHMPRTGKTPNRDHCATLQGNKTIQTLTPLARRYAALLSRYSPAERDNLIATDENDTAECLFLNVMLSGYGDPDIIMHFRDSEMGDTNRNGLREFIDAWGNPIHFLRWAPGFNSPFQPSPYAARGGDPFDIEFADLDTFTPDGNSTTTRIATRLVPLIISPGPDQQLGIKMQGKDYDEQLKIEKPAPNYAARGFDPFYPVRPAGNYLGIGPANDPDMKSAPLERLYGSVLSSDSREAADNIHSHALSR